MNILKFLSNVFTNEEMWLYLKIRGNIKTNLHKIIRILGNMKIK